MKFEKLAELAGDIIISEEKKQDMLISCKKEYLQEKRKHSAINVLMMDLIHQHRQL